jgi:hypothetical protein
MRLCCCLDPENPDQNHVSVAVCQGLTPLIYQIEEVTVGAGATTLAWIESPGLANGDTLTVFADTGAPSTASWFGTLDAGWRPMS